VIDLHAPHEPLHGWRDFLVLGILGLDTQYKKFLAAHPE
jgi:hypothetical protein